MKTLLITLGILCSSLAFAQSYNSAVGVRGGLINAFTFKKAINDYSAGEVITSFQYRGLIVTGLYTIQKPYKIESERLEWYYGGGGHVGFLNSYRNHPFLEDNRGSAVIVGIDGIIGTEYTFPSIPLNISLDYKPAFNIIGYTGFWFDSISLGVRYVIN